MIALREAWQHGLLQRAHWWRNVAAGTVVAVVALPLAMAFAIASGARPEQGLYTAIVAGLAVSLFGGSRVQIAGPTGAFVVILSSITAQHGLAGLQLATLMAGVILILLGVARLGSIIRYIPGPVITGFTAGIAVLIWVGQWSYFFGLPAAGGTLHFHEKLHALLLQLPHLHLPTAALGSGCLALILLWRRLWPRIPAPLVALLAATTLQSIYPLPGVATLGSAFGGIPQQLPQLAWPEASMRQLLSLLGPAFTIAMLGAIESLLSAVVADGMGHTRHNSNQELIGQGLANVLAPLAGGFAATGAIARTATNVRNGANSPLAGIVHCLLLLLIMLLLAPLAAAIPLACLAAILFVVAWDMSELPHVLRTLGRAPRPDVIILLITFALTVLADLVVAVNVGVILAALHFMRRMAHSVEVVRQSAAELHLEQVPPGVQVYQIRGPLFFGATDTLEQAIAHDGEALRALILRLGDVPFMDMSGLQTLEHLLQRLQQRGIQCRLCEANTRVHGKLQRAGLLQGHGPLLQADVMQALDSLEPPSPV